MNIDKYNTYIRIIQQSKRFNVIGSSGSGKSYVSKRLAEIKGISFIEIDQLFWLPNWEPSPDEIFFPKLIDALKAEAWVLDGNYSRANDIKWKDVEVIIWINFSFVRTIFQSLKRTISRILKNEELWPETGNKESFTNSFFSKDSVVWWSISNYSKVKKKYYKLFCDKNFSHISMIELKTPKEINFVLSRI